MNQESPDVYNIKTRIGRLLFDIYLDASYRTTDAPRLFNQHNHPNYEVHFIVEGSGRLVLEQEEVMLQSNHYYVIPPGRYHSVLPDPRLPLSKYTIRFDWVEMSENDTYFPEHEAKALKAALHSLDFFCGQHTEDDRQLLSKINRELEQRALGYYAKLQAFFNEILLHIIRDAAPSLRSEYPPPHRVTDDSRSLIIDAFFDRYEAELTLEELAEKLYLSPRQTSRILKKMYNTTFQQKLNDIRVEEGKKRLRSTDHTVMAIADQLGFASHAIFCSIFKKKIGLTPQAYRKARRSETYF